MNDFNGNFSNNSTSNQKFAAPFTPDQLGPKVNNDVYDNVRVEVSFIYYAFVCIYNMYFILFHYSR